VEANLDAEFAYGIDIAIQLYAWQAVIRNTNRHHTSGSGHRIEDRDAIPPPGQVVGCAQSSRPCAHDGDAFEMLLLRWRNPPFQRRAMIGGKALQIADGDGQVKLPTAAGILARCR